MVFYPFFYGTLLKERGTMNVKSVAYAGAAVAVLGKFLSRSSTSGFSVNPGKIDLVLFIRARAIKDNMCGNYRF